MRIGILGAAGIIGRELTRCLVRDGRKDLVLADLRGDSVEALADSVGASAATLDVKDPRGTAQLLKGCGLAVNASPYYFNLEVMEACLAAGCDYFDLGGLYHMTRRQLEKADEFERAGRTAILGCGKAPGITNVFVAFGAREFDRIRSVRLRSGRRSLEPDAGVHLPYSAQTLLDELTLRPVVLEDGRLREVEPLSRRESVRHPEPFGVIDYVATLHSELATLPTFLPGVAEMDFIVALTPQTQDALERIVSLGLASDRRIDHEGGRVSARTMTVAALSRLPSAPGREVWITEAELAGEREGRAMTVVLRATGTERENGTAIAAAVGVDLVARGRVRQVGVHAPETVIPPEEFLDGLHRRGITLHETRTEVHELGS